MGPENIGSRVDDAVVYLGKEPDVENAKRIDKALSKGMGQPKLGAAPPGMESLSPISSYAEYMPGTSSSHGSNRGEIVRKTVTEKLLGATFSGVLEQQVDRYKGRRHPPETHQLVGAVMGHDPTTRTMTASTSSTHEIMGQSLEKAGYNPAKPSRIQTPTQSHLKQALAKRRSAMGYEK